MNELSTKVIIDCNTGIETIVPLTQDEIDAQQTQLIIDYAQVVTDA